MSDVNEDVAIENEKAELQAALTKKEKEEADALLAQIEKEAYDKSVDPEFTAWLESYYLKIGKIELSDVTLVMLETAFIAGKNGAYKLGYDDGYDAGYDQALQNNGHVCKCGGECNHSDPEVVVPQ